MKSIQQFRFYHDNSENNYPIGLTYGTLLSGNILNNFGPVSQLGIQAKPGTKFYLNKSKSSIIVGSTGIYELDLGDLGTISAINFDAESLDRVVADKEDFIIVDIIYDKAGAIL